MYKIEKDDAYDEITIVIPTYNRHKYLQRILEMYQNFNIQIVIADSTNETSENIYLKNNNIKYIHMPNMLITDKLINILDYVTTKYVLFCADDDFVFPNAIKKIIKFLDFNNDYVCAQGEILYYKYLYDNNTLEYNIFDNNKHDIKDYVNISIEENSIQERLDNYCKPYRHSIYGIHRYDIIKKNLKKLQKYKILEPILYELCQEILTVISGKIKELNCLYHLREYIMNSGGKIHKDIPTLIKENHPEIIFAKELIKTHLLEHGIRDHSEEILVNKSLSNFLDFIKEVNCYAEYQPKLRVISNNKDNYFLNTLYKNEQYLIEIENIIKKNKIYSGFTTTLKSLENTTVNNISEFSEKIDKIYQNYSNNTNIALYGAGYVSKIIRLIFKEQIKLIVDKDERLHNDIVFPINFLKKKNDEYDIIIITVINRGDEIKNYLEKELTITKPIIII